MTGWSNPGGSTMSLMSLCDMFNERGVDCTMYGPHKWFLSRCSKGELHNNFSLNTDDILIVHFLELPQRPPARKVILSCHEKNIFPIKQRHTEGADVIRFISQDQKEWQGVDGVVIPNNIRGITKSKCKEEGIAGIIGTVDKTKGTHISIQRALDDGCKKVLIYGNYNDDLYFENFIGPYLYQTPEKVVYLGQKDNKQAMYDSISCVYQSNDPSLPEAFGRVRAECILAGIPYHGNEHATTDFELWEEDKIFDAWKDLLEI